jgi:RND superfamily putative drug exporter
MTSPRNLAARAGRWSAHHRKTAILGWIAFVVLATVLGGRVGQNNLDDSATGNGESKRGAELIAAGFPERAGEQVLVQGASTDAAVRDVVNRLGQIKSVTDVAPPRASTDGRSVVVAFEVPEERVEEPLAAVAAAQRSHPGVRVEQFGEASAAKALAAEEAKDGKNAERISFVLMLIILLVAFGAIVAAGVPLVLGATAVVAAVGLIGPVSQAYALPSDVAQLMVIIGLAVGVDYAMFYSRRMLEERDRGHSVTDAVEIAAATSGRAVLISGVTVMTAMAGLLFAGNPIFVGFGIGTMLVVAVAMLGSMTFLPAMLSFLAEKNWLEKGRVPYLTKRRHRTNGESRVWNAILTRVLKRPLVSATVATAALVALSIPALGMQFKDPGFDGYSGSQPVIQTYERLQAAFPANADPVIAVVKADDVTAAPVQAAIRDLHPSQVEISRDRTIAQVALADENGDVDALRSVAEVAITGPAASTKDFTAAMTAHLPLVFAFVGGLTFILLLVTFRSIVVPLKAIVLNLLSVGGAYGVLTLVFQHGFGESLLGFRSVGGVAPVIPLFLFVILFGLSMDYHVLVISRIREAVDRGMGNDAAVAHGIKTTAGVVTSAALVMVAVFGSFALSSDQMAKQIGLGLAVAILIDATIIRAVLLPATMKLLGARNWYLPQRLGWLPQVATA